MVAICFFFNDTATTEIYTSFPTRRSSDLDADRFNAHLSSQDHVHEIELPLRSRYGAVLQGVDRKSTRLNSSHLVISYAVFCLKKKRRGAAMLVATSTR